MYIITHTQKKSRFVPCIYIFEDYEKAKNRFYSLARINGLEIWNDAQFRKTAKDNKQRVIFEKKFNFDDETFDFLHSNQ